jgi:hypothetical protein
MPNSRHWPKWKNADETPQKLVQLETSNSEPRSFHTSQQVSLDADAGDGDARTPQTCARDTG